MNMNKKKNWSLDPIPSVRMREIIKNKFGSLSRLSRITGAGRDRLRKCIDDPSHQPGWLRIIMNHADDPDFTIAIAKEIDPGRRK